MKALRVVALLVVSLSATIAFAQTPVGDADKAFGPFVLKTFDRSFSVHGVAADKQLLFVGEVLDIPQVHVSDRLTGRDLGSLPQPPGDLSSPMNIRIRNVTTRGAATKGEIVLLDAFGPDAVGSVIPHIYVYQYDYSPVRGLRASIKETHSLPMDTNAPTDMPNGFIYPSGIELLPDGDVVVVDIIGLYVSDASMEHWRLALMSPEFTFGTYCSTVTVDGQQVPGVYMAVRDDNWHKERIPYQMNTGGMGPVMPALKGATYIDLTDEVAVVKVAPPGGIFSISRTALLDAKTPPFAKPYKHLVEPEIGLSDFSGDVAYDHYHPDSEWVYWQRVPSESGEKACAGAHPYSEKWSPIYRISVLTGEIQLVAESWMLFDFPTVLATLPPVIHSPYTQLVSSNVMEERVPKLNALISKAARVPPTIVPTVFVDAY